MRREEDDNPAKASDAVRSEEPTRALTTGFGQLDLAPPPGCSCACRRPDRTTRPTTIGARGRCRSTASRAARARTGPTATPASTAPARPPPCFRARWTPGRARTSPSGSEPWASSRWRRRLPSTASTATCSCASPSTTSTATCASRPTCSASRCTAPSRICAAPSRGASRTRRLARRFRRRNLRRQRRGDGHALLGVAPRRIGEEVAR